MKINFNNVRRKACRAHDRMVKILNRGIKDGVVTVEVDELEDVMNDLRMAIGSIAATYDEDNDDFKDIFQEMYPEEGEHMEFFNPENED